MKTVWLTFLLVLIAGCDSLEQVIEIDLPEHKPQLVANGIVESESGWRIHIAESQTIQDRNSFFQESDILKAVAVTNGEIDVAVDGQPYTTLAHVESGFYDSDKVPPPPGSEIEFTISAENFDTATIRETVPPRPQITNSGEHVGPGPDGFTQRYKFSFSDQATQEREYYSLEVNAIGQDGLRSGMVFSVENASRLLPDLDEFEDEDLEYFGQLVFGDDFIDGDVVEVEMYIRFFDDNIPFEIGLARVSESIFRYQTSIDAQAEARDNPFAEPVPIYTNSDGGQGVIGTSALQVVYTGVGSF